MKDNEIIIVQGCKTISKLEGYGRNIKWYEKNKEWNKRTFIFMDALELDMINTDDKNRIIKQLDLNLINRELNKSYCAFSSYECLPIRFNGIITGKWGCGSFGGNKYIKILIQILAASQSNLDLLVFSDIDEDKLFRTKLNYFFSILSNKNIKINDIYNILVNDLKKELQLNDGTDILDFIINIIK